MNTHSDGGAGEFGDPPQTLVPPQRMGLYEAVFKRVLDVALVLLAAPAVVLVVAVLALLIARDGRPPFCRDRRLGRDGRAFTLWTLRSPGLETGARATAFGQLLRKTGLDELPQLWNVLKGDMSLVGPRPMLPEQKPLYTGRDCFALRPGVTGPSQVWHRDEASARQRAEVDADYARRLSFTTDLRVLLATVSAAVRGTGR